MQELLKQQVWQRVIVNVDSAVNVSLASPANSHQHSEESTLSGFRVLNTPNRPPTGAAHSK
jgi:hypothetical protein